MSSVNKDTTNDIIQNLKKCNPNDILCKPSVGYRQNIDSIQTNSTPPKSAVPLYDNSVNAPVPFWVDDPNIIFNKTYLFEFFPTENMSYEQKLNAISRLIIIVTIVSFVVSQSLRVLLVSALTLFCIYLLYNQHRKGLRRRNGDKEGFESIKDQRRFTNGGEGDNDEPITGNLLTDVMIQNRPQEDILDKSVFDPPNEHNPFSNVLMTDYDYNPNKKPAAPSYNNDINDSILNKTKTLVSNINSTQPDITDKLYKDLGDELYFEQSMRQFYSNPSTTIPNDQASFADFCYGGMVSCKEGNMFACARNLSRYTF